MRAEPLRDTARMLRETVGRASRAQVSAVLLELPTVIALAEQLDHAADALEDREQESPVRPTRGARTGG